MKVYQTYEHHGRKVWVRSDLQGYHRECCLCYNCRRFCPADRDNSCPIANEVFANCEAHDIVTPVWECPDFLAK